MKLRTRILLIFALTLLSGTAILYFVSRGLLLSSFRRLEDQQMRQTVNYALTAISQQSANLSKTTNDYAFWDRTYEYVIDPTKSPIDSEFQNGAMEGLGLNLVFIRNLAGETVYAKAYDSAKRETASVPAAFLADLLNRNELRSDAVAHSPRDGILAFPDGDYLISIRPILNSQRQGAPRGVLVMARKFDETAQTTISDFTSTTVRLEQYASPRLPGDFQLVKDAFAADSTNIPVQPLSEDQVGGYAAISDLFDQPLLIMGVYTPRLIYHRGEVSQRYLFGAVLAGIFLLSLVIFFFVQKFVLSRISSLTHEVEQIAKRDDTTQRVQFAGQDEISSLGAGINGMLEEIERSHRQFLFITQNIQQVFWVREAKTRRYDFISSAFEKVWGIPSSRMQQNPLVWRALVLREDVPAIDRMVADESASKPTECYFRITHPGGEIRWLWDRSFPAHAPDGTLTHVIGLTEDITVFKQNEEALLRSREDLELRVQQRTAELAERGELVKLLIDFLPVAMYGIGGDGRILFCNPAAVSLLGYSSDAEFLNGNSHQLFHYNKPDGSHYDVTDCPIFKCLHDGQDAHVPGEVFWRKDGTAVPVEYDARPIRRDGRIVGVVVSFVDVTERKRQEIQLRHSQKLESVGRLAAGIAHEINTPIQFLGDNTRFLQNSFQDELQLVNKYEELFAAASAGAVVSPLLLQEISEVREKADWDYLKEEIPKAAEQMLEGLGRVSTIVRGMKEFSHVDRSAEKAPADLNRALQSTLIVARNELKYVADVETHFAELPPIVCHLGDLNQVFLNLLVNAAHAIEDVVKDTNTKGKITVSTRTDGDWAEISIADTGGGIPEDLRDKIFDPFFTTKGVGKGTGQGLALARAVVVEKHGGTINFESHLGVGTTFIVRLPFLAVPLREEALTR